MSPPKATFGGPIEGNRGKPREWKPLEMQRQNVTELSGPGKVSHISPSISRRTCTSLTSGGSIRRNSRNKCDSSDVSPQRLRPQFLSWRGSPRRASGTWQRARLYQLPPTPTGECTARENRIKKGAMVSPFCPGDTFLIIPDAIATLLLIQLQLVPSGFLAKND